MKLYVPLTHFCCGKEAGITGKGQVVQPNIPHHVDNVNTPTFLSLVFWCILNYRGRNTTIGLHDEKYIQTENWPQGLFTM